MPDVSTLFNEFVDELIAGRQPDAELFLDRADSLDAKKELAALIDQSLTMAPESATHPRDGSGQFIAPLSRSEMETIVEDALARPRGWPTAIPEWIENAGLTEDELARETVVAGGFEPSEQNVSAARGWIEQMERGLIGARDVSMSALAALASTLGTTLDAFLWEARGESAGGITAFRADKASPTLAEQLNAVADVLDDGINGEPENEVDRWFSA